MMSFSGNLYDFLFGGKSYVGCFQKYGKDLAVFFQFCGDQSVAKEFVPKSYLENLNIAI